MNGVNRLLYRAVCLSVGLLMVFDLDGQNSDSILNMLQSQSVAYDQKTKIVDDIYRFAPDKQISLLSALIQLSEKQQNGNDIAKFYILNAHAHLFCERADSCLYNLHRADRYINSVENPETLGLYNYVWGDYYNSNYDYEKSHKFYYKAIDYFQNSVTYAAKTKILSIYHNMAFAYIQKGETTEFNKILNEMFKIISTLDDEAATYYWGLLSYYYGEKHKQHQQIVYLDSAIICDQKVVDIYETRKPDRLYPEEMAYRYINLASNSLKKENPNYETINAWVKKATALANPTDTAMLVNCAWIEGLTMYKLGDVEASEQKLVDLILRMDRWQYSKNLGVYAQICGTLSEIYQQKGDYKNALHYEQKRGKCNINIYNAEKYKVIKEIQTKYETEKKEQEIASQKRINIFILSICLLIAIILALIIRWQKLNRRLLQKQLEIIRQEKAEIEKTIASQEIRIEDARAKELAISEEIYQKEKLLADAKLKNDENGLDALRVIDLLTSQKEELQSSISKAQKSKIERENRHNEIVSELQGLIRRRIHVSRQGDLLNTISKIDSSCVILLKNKGLNQLDIQYSMLIASGAKNEELCAIYSVAEQTVRVRRSTIRGALDLTRSDNLDVFLMKLLFAN